MKFLFIILSAQLLSAEPDNLFRQGQAALDDGLWEVAAIHFSDLLQSKSLAPEEKSGAAIRLAEAYIRGGEANKALDLLDESFVTISPAIHFWKGHALAGLGRFSDALKEFELDTVFPVESALTRVSLHLTLDQTDQALDQLQRLTENSEPSISIPAKLREVEILLDRGGITEARDRMPPLDDLPEKFLSRANFLEASLLLAEGKPGEASIRFAALLADPTGQSLDHHHAAALGFADSLAARGERAQAADTLLDFLQQRPDSPFLSAIFSRFLEWLPLRPAPNDPILERLAQWIPPAALPVTGLIATNGAGVTGAWPVDLPADELAAHAIYTRALGFLRIPDASGKMEAKHLLTRLVLDYPQHPLATRARLHTARRLLDEGDAEAAFALMDMVRETPGSPPLAGEAAFLKARASYQSGDLKSAATLFDEATKALPASAADSSRLNAAISRIRSGDATTIAVALVGPDGQPIQNPILQADLELEQALAVTPAADGRIAIEAFLTRHPKHPRVPEARLFAAEAALSGVPPDLSMARAQLDTIAAEPAAVEAVSAPRLALARLRLVDLGNDPAATITAARSFIETFPADPAAAEASLTLGRSLFQTASYNDARLVLEKLAATDTDSARAQAAWLVAARSAALVATPQSREEALILFDSAIAAKGTLGPIVMMEKARLMIDLNRLPEASAFLKKWFDSMPSGDPLRIPAGLLFGEATYAQGDKVPAALTESMAVYDELLDHPEAKAGLIHRIQYLRGMTLEQLPNPANPALKREGQALAAYHSVLTTAASPPPEFHYLERCGFRALEILEKEQRWIAAIDIAKKIASFKGPRAEEAATRARQIQLKNMIWDD